MLHAFVTSYPVCCEADEGFEHGNCGSRAVLEVTVKCFSENAEAVELIMGKQQALLYQQA